MSLNESAGSGRGEAGVATPATSPWAAALIEASVTGLRLVVAADPV
jgi:hypothetical protein